MTRGGEQQVHDRQPLIALQMFQTLPVGLTDDLQDHLRQGQELSRVHAHVFLQDAHEQLELRPVLPDVVQYQVVEG